MPGRLAAEFVVVVLGVIVGLGVDEWRQARSEVAEEASYYDRLVEDIEADVDNWELLVSLLDPKDQALARIEMWLAAPNVSNERVLRALAEDLAMGAIFSGSVPVPRRSTYTELLSTGKLEVVRDDTFRAALIDYHFAFENLQRRVSSRTTDYEPLAYSLVPREVRGGGDNFALPDLSVSELRSLAERVSGQDLKSAVVAERNRTAFLRGQFEELLVNTRALLARAEAH